MSTLGPDGRNAAFRRAGGIYALVAAAMLILIGVSMRIIWPISLLGYTLDPETYRIIGIEPGSPADRTGLMEGDRVVAIYDQAVERYLTSFPIRYIRPPGDVAPLSVQRGDQLLETSMLIPPPDRAFQAIKLAFLLSALVCWVTGYLLGVVRRHDAHSLGPVSLFWLGTSGIYGSLMLASYGAPPLMRLISWLLAIVFVPLGIHIHLLYPPRRSNPYVPRLTTLVYGAAWFVFGGAVGGALLAGWSFVQTDKLLRRLVPIEILTALAIVAWTLFRAYRGAVAAHTRRQIRLIGTACASVVLIVVLLFVLPRIVLGHYPIHPNWGIVVTALVPLAYLFGGITPDLYRLERVVSRLVLHLLTLTLLAGAVAIAEATVPATGYLVLFVSVAVAVAVYPRIHGVLRYVVQHDAGVTDVLPALDSARSQVTHSLEVPALVSALVEGVSDQFDRPSLAFYQGDIHGSNELHLITQRRLPDLPSMLPAGALAERLVELRQIVDSKSLVRHIGPGQLSDLEQTIVLSPALALWCPIVHSRGYLLGLLVLGMRGDLDPYRDIDQRNLQRLMDAASLAFSKGAALAEAHEAEQLMRQMYYRMLEAYDIAAHQLAAELHAEVINGVAMLNLYDLEQLASETDEPKLRTRIQTVLEGERTLIAQLRGICEQLHPAGLEDPMGLPGAIRKQLESVEAMWDGHCCFQLRGNQLPLDTAVQREVFRVAQEAINNAVKHARATTITVSLIYPAAGSTETVLEIVDDGSSGSMIAPREGHLGVYIMREAARAVHGHLTLATTATGGGQVVLSFPATYSRHQDAVVPQPTLLTSAAEQPTGRRTETNLARSEPGFQSHHIGNIAPPPVP